MMIMLCNVKADTVIGLLTLTDIIHYAQQHPSIIADIANKTIDKLRLGFKEVVSISRHAKAFEAFLLIREKV